MEYDRSTETSSNWPPLAVFGQTNLNPVETDPPSPLFNLECVNLFNGHDMITRSSLC